MSDLTVNDVSPPRCERCERLLVSTVELNRRIDWGVDLCESCRASDEQDACWCGYGFFLGGDPRQFTPDEEMNSPAEIARWRAACEQWEQGKPVEPEPEEHGPWTDPETGTVTLGACPSADAVGGCHAVRSFGLGSYACQQHPLPADAWKRWTGAREDA